MKKNNIILPLYCLCTFCSCDSCDSDSAKITTANKDKNENYKLGIKIYKKDREKIKDFFEEIYDKQSDFDEVFNEVLPNEIEKKYHKSIEGFFYVNNNIVLSGLFTSILQEKVFIDLIIEKIKDNNTKNNLKKVLSDCLKNFLEKIKEKLPNIKNNENQILYNKVFDFNKLFNDEVLKIIIPDVIDAIVSDNSKLGKDIKKYKVKEWNFGISHILLSKLENSNDRENDIQNKLKNLKVNNK